MLGWALNEEESVEDYINRAGALLAALTDDYELILIDDGSTDNTWAIVTECQRTRPWLKPYRNDRNRGSGYNTKRAISLATKDYLFWQTVDWAYDIRRLMQALGDLASVDVLQGVRVETTSARGDEGSSIRHCVQGTRVCRQLSPGSNPVQAPPRRLPERHRLSESAHSVGDTRNGKRVHQS
jgi:hypothetical protein